MASPFLGEYMDSLNYHCFECKKSYLLNGDIDTAERFVKCSVCGTPAKLMGRRPGGYVKVWNYDPSTQSAEDNRHMCGMPD